MDRAQQVGTIVLAAVLIAVGVYDVGVIVCGVGHATVSEMVRHYAKEYPMVPFAAGMLAGHLFWH